MQLHQYFTCGIFLLISLCSCTHRTAKKEVDDVSDRCTGKSIIDIFGSKRNGQAIVCRSLRILSHFYAIINHCFRFDLSAVSSLYCATVKKRKWTRQQYRRYYEICEIIRCVAAPVDVDSNFLSYLAT